MRCWGLRPVGLLVCWGGYPARFAGVRRRPGLQPGRVRPIRARGARLGGVFNTPLHRYGHSPRWGGYPARFAGVRRRPGLQPGRVRPIRALRPVGLLVRVPVRPVGAPDHSPGRNPGRSGYVPFGPCGPVGGRIQYAPTAVRASLRAFGPFRGRQGGRMRYAPGFRPGLWSGGPTGRSGYVHSPRWGVEVLGALRPVGLLVPV